MHWLVISAFVAGNSWGPVIQVVPTPDLRTCQTLKDQVLADVKKQAQSNLVGALEHFDEGEATGLTRGTREIARVRCVQTR
ncbi:hypothetical protein WKW79_29050 [Variovorax robiniae]|uniref:DUF1311 domain-containing protein n=1 Tax=Variovorax robiniae TaxID=1836199 RepID=A0ABU8XHY8_9BURK